MLELHGPANNSVVTGTPIRWRQPAPPCRTLDASKARERGGLTLPDEVVEGLTLTAKVTVQYDEAPDLDDQYGEFADSSNRYGAAKIRKAIADGYLVIRRRNRGRNEYNTWISSEPVRQPRVALRTKGSPCFPGGYLNRTEARGPAYEAAVAQQRELYRMRVEDEIGASVVTIRLYLHGAEIAKAYAHVELGSWKQEDACLADVVADMMHEARETAALWLADMRAALCPCQDQTGGVA